MCLRRTRARVQRADAPPDPNLLAVPSLSPYGPCRVPATVLPEPERRQRRRLLPALRTNASAGALSAPDFVRPLATVVPGKLSPQPGVSVLVSAALAAAALLRQHRCCAHLAACAEPQGASTAEALVYAAPSSPHRCA